MSWFVYILKCADGTLYTGITTNVEKRVAQHNGEKPGGAKYTAHKRPVEMCYVELAGTRSQATLRELEIKKLSRDRKLLLCSQHNVKTGIPALV